MSCINRHEPQLKTGAAVFILLAVAMVLFTKLAVAADTGAQSTRLTIDQILSMHTPSDIQVSPEGKWVAYVIERNDEDQDEAFSQVWMTSIDGGINLPMTAVYANASQPRWNPDGSSLAFLGKRSADKESKDAKSQVWILDRRGGEAQQYTDIKQGVEGFSWSPDGKRMLLIIQDPKPEDLQDEKDGNKAGEDKDEEDRPVPWVIDRLQFKADYVGYLDRRRKHLFVYNGEGEPVQITSGDYDNSDPQWSPDGKRIAFVSKRDGDPDANTNSDIWVVSSDPDAKEFPLVQVTTNKGSDASPGWSPDGKTITYTTVTEPEKLWYATANLAVISAGGGGQAKILTKQYDRMVFNPEFSADGKSIYFTTDDGGDVPLVKVDAKTGKLNKMTGSDVSVSDFALGKNGEIALLQSSPQMSPDVYVIDGDESRRITRLNDKLLEGVSLGRVERVKVAGYQGDMVESFVYYPSDHDSNKPYPTIFWLHGGPVGQHDSSFNVWGQLYAANGYIAVLPNPHGSDGYGEPFTYTLFQQWGVSDFADVDAIADHMVNSGISDADRLGVGGWSYGGILTNYVITKSTRFKGAVSGASEVNHRANYGHDIYQNVWEGELGLPWENIEAWEAISPFNDLGKVTTPTLVIGGKEDWNVPIQNSEQLYQVLKRRGIETQLIVYPGESHGLVRPSFLRDRYNRHLDWYQRFVKAPE